MTHEILDDTQHSKGPPMTHSETDSARSSRYRLLERSVVTLFVLVAVLGGYVIHSASADGVPTMPSMYYSGTLEEDGIAVEGTRQLRLRLLASPDSDAEMFCESTPNEGAGTPGEVTIRGGRFRFALSDECVDAMREHPDVFAELVVGGEALPRAKIGAVPYAIEAEHALRADDAQHADTAGGASGVLASQVVPPGAVIAFDLDACPAGWSSLASAAGRTLVGVSSSHARGATFGSETRTLGASELPMHSHTATAASAAPRILMSNGYGECANQGWWHVNWELAGLLQGGCSAAQEVRGAGLQGSLINESHTHAVTVASAGAGQAFSIEQPSLALLYCRKD